MSAVANKIQGWKIVSLSTIVVSSIFILILLANGFNDLGLRIAIRATARTSCLLFVPAFVASSLRCFSSHKFVRWLRKNRRYFGLSMAISQGFHALAIISLAILSTDPYLRNNHGGNLGYFFIFAMVVTSFQPTANLLGNRGWQLLHGVGMYYLWLAFIYTFASRLHKSLIMYLPFVSLLAIALIIRLLALRKKSISRA